MAAAVMYWKVVGDKGSPRLLIRGDHDTPTHYYSRVRKQWIEDAKSVAFDFVYGDGPGVGPPSDTEPISEDEAAEILRGWG
jgi:hypothetical protein